MSDWLEIDKQIEKADAEPICFFEDDFQLSSKIKQIDHLPDTKEYLLCLGMLKRLSRLLIFANPLESSFLQFEFMAWIANIQISLTLEMTYANRTDF